jgi:hypothetical protein
VRKGRKGLRRFGGTRTGRTAQLFERVDGLLAVFEQVLVDGALCLRQAMRGGDQHPALRHPTRG